MSITSKWHVKDGVLYIEAGGFEAIILPNEDPLKLCAALEEVLKQAAMMDAEDPDWKQKLWGAGHVSP